MRYRKDTIVINPKEDIPLLLYVRNCRFTSHQQLRELLRYDSVLMARSTFNWRLERLVKSGYLEQIPNVNFAHSSAYAITRLGLAVLESHGEYAVAVNSGSRNVSHPSQLFHGLELTAIRLALARARLLVQWKSEIEIASSNVISTAPYAKDYDAIVDVWVGNEIRRFALEYERSLKKGREYEDIKIAIESETQVPCVLYLTPHPDVMLALLRYLTPTVKPIGFGTVKAFCDLLLGVNILTSEANPMITLEEFLRYAHPLYVQAS